MAENEDFLVEIQQNFLEESKELLEKTEHCYLELEKKSSDPSLLAEIMRCVHTIKGVAGAVDFQDLATFLHTLENLLIKVKDGGLVIDTTIINTLLESNDTIKNYLDVLTHDSGGTIDTQELSGRINALVDTEKQGESDKNKVEVSAEKIGEIIFQQGRAEKKAQKETVGTKAQKTTPKKQEDNFIRLPLSKIDNMLDSFGEQVILQSALEFARHDLEHNSDLINKTILQLNKITYDLQQSAISLRMLSLHQFFNRCQRVVRDVSLQVKKEIRLQTSGEETELDKSIIDQLVGPLSHILRNSIDHGIEEADERKKKGKPDCAVVVMKASQQGGFFCLEISDDGKGLDRKRVLEKAIEKGIVTKGEDLTTEEVDNLVLLSGFSTKETATDISGRGVGMDAVSSAINGLGGTLRLSSVPDKGLTVQIRLPLTLALFNGMIVTVSGRKYILPNSDVKEICHVDLGNERKIGRSESVINVKDVVMPRVDLKKLLFSQSNGKGKEQTRGKGLMIIVFYQQKEYAFQVDEIIGQQRVVLKKLGKEIECLPGVAGATILGDGKVALVLEVNELIQLHQTLTKTN